MIFKNESSIRETVHVRGPRLRRGAKQYRAGYFWEAVGLFCGILFSSSEVQAEQNRYAIIVGNNRGADHEVELRYAERDAHKMEQVVINLGQVRAENLVLLLGKSAEDVRRALIEVNARIRQNTNESNQQSMLLVYYSGHADNDALHLGKSMLPLSEIQGLIRGSPSKVRMLILDSCRSGTITRVKGGKPVAAFPIQLSENSSDEGVIFITSSSADEDSHESDEFKGSIFTHHWVSALLGAADFSGDGRVSVWEAYRYAYHRTIEFTSQILSGTQHPTFEYDLRGREDVVLTNLTARSENQGLVQFEAIGNCLLIQSEDGGQVVAEVLSGYSRQLVLPTGEYFVRCRKPDYLLEGKLLVAAGGSMVVDESKLSRVQYARLVRKGVGEKFSQGLFVFFRNRGSIAENQGWMFSGGVGYRMELPWFSISPELSFGRMSYDNQVVIQNEQELLTMVLLSRSMDFSWLTILFGVEVGAAWLYQTFDTRGIAPARNSAAFVAGFQLELLRELGKGFFLGLRVSGDGYVFEGRDQAGSSHIESVFVPVVGLSAGKYY